MITSHTPGEYMKDTILIISPILALIISAITVVINLSIRGEDNFQKTLDLLNAHTEYGDDDRVINRFTKEVVLRQIIRRQIARAYKPFSILSFTWLVIKSRSAGLKSDDNSIPSAKHPDTIHNLSKPKHSLRPYTISTHILSKVATTTNGWKSTHG